MSEDPHPRPDKASGSSLPAPDAAISKHRESSWLDRALAGLLQRPTAVVLATLTAVLLGTVSLFNLPVSVLPDVERPVGVAVIEAPTLSRLEISQRLVEPLERRLRAIPNVVVTRSLIDEGLARIEFESEWQTDPDQLRIAAERARAAIVDPSSAQLQLAVQTGQPEPVLEIAVLGGSAHQRTDFVERTLIPELARIEGAGDLRRIGGTESQVVIEPLAAALAARGLTVSDLERRLERVGIARAAGAVRDGGINKPILIQERIGSLQELQRILVGKPERIPLTDVARIVVEPIAEHGFARVSGADAILVELHRAPQANAVRLSRLAAQTLDRLRASNPQFELRLLVDRSLEVRAAIRQLLIAAGIGILLGVMVLRFFLGSFRPTLALATVIPCSILISFGPFLIFDISLDVISLAGLVLALGMLVDSAVVVLDAISNVVSEGQKRDSLEDSVRQGTAEITTALVAGFLTTAAVFVPLFYLEGLARAFFGVQAFAITGSLLVALVLSLTLVPVIVNGLLKAGAGRAKSHRQRVLRNPGRARYLELLAGALERPTWVVATGLLAAVIAIVSSVSVLPRALFGGPVGFSQETTQVALGGEYETLRSLDQAARLEHLESIQTLVDSTDARDLVLRYHEVDPADPGDRLLPPGRLRAVGDLERMRRGLASRPNLAARIGRQGSALENTFSRRQDGIEALGAIGPGSNERGIITLAISAPSRAECRTLASELESQLAKLDIKGTVRSLPMWQRSAYSLRFRQAQLARLELSAAELRSGLRTALREQRVGRIDIPGVSERPRLRSMSVPNPGLLPIVSTATNGIRSRTVTLGELAELEPARQQAPWLRVDGQPTLFLDLLPIDDREQRARLEAVVAGFATGSVLWTGDTHEIERSFSQLGFALALAVVLVFLCIAGLYESLTLPLAVLATLPIALAGGLVSLVFSSQSLNILSFLGLVLLVGIVVNNSIVLLHRVEEKRRELGDQETKQAVLEAASERYRPILMTTLTTVLGLLPLAILPGEGTGMRRSLAIAVSGGLTTALLGSLLLVPCVYLLCRRKSP